MSTQISHAVQDYLKTLHHLGGVDGLVSPVDIATRLGVRPPSVTGMLKRLAEAGLIEYEPGKRAKLTSLGVQEARRVIRRHRLVEVFLHRILKLDWSEIDAEAEALEHAISPRLEKAIADYLGEPLEDPHGHPIPNPEGNLAQRQLKALCDFSPGQRILVREVTDEHPDRLRRWQQLGLMPGVLVELRSYQPLDDVFEFLVDGNIIRVGQEGLRGVFGELYMPTSSV
jgi:DtxR family transcriptional regulator, Mn-dependent transcriptional regulator